MDLLKQEILVIWVTEVFGMKKHLKKRKNRKGTVTLETAIFLPIFFFIFFAIFGVFGVILARHQVRHASIQTAKSLSHDSFLTEQFDTRDESKGELLYKSISSLAETFIRWLFDNSYYSTIDKWYTSSNSASGQDIVKKRFIGFLAGGNKDQADKYLQTLGVKNGIDGITIQYWVANGELTLQVDYTVQYWFKMFGAEDIPMSHTIKTKMWGYDGGSGGAPATT